MNNYKLFLLDGNDYAELDVEGLDFSTTFSVANISDISQRKDSISKNIKLKATKNNNRIFGNLYNINRYTDSNTNQNLFVNYKPSNKLDCLVYENDTLILKGQMQVIAYKNQTYEAIITGSIVNFFSLLGDKKLTDLDFSEYKHLYNVSNIVNSFSTSIVKDNVVQPFELGSGYVYPHIVYKVTDGANNVNSLYYDNFRPAIYVDEYLDKVFAQPSLSGFTYQVNGSNDFKNEIKSLIIPNNEESLTNRGTDLYNWTKTTQPYPQGVWKDDNSNATGFWFTFNSQAASSFFEVETAWTQNSGINGVWKNKGDIKIDGTAKASVNLNYQTVLDPVEAGRAVTVRLELVARDYRPNTNPSNNPIDKNFYNFSSFNVLAQVTKVITAPLTQQNLEFNLNFVDVELKENQQFGLRIMLYNVSFGQAATWFSANYAEWKIDKASYGYRINDYVTPIPPLEVTQKDFIKSLLKMYNLYVYSNIDNPKHIIFEKYDDYYSDASKLLNSVDWSDKIDYTTDPSLTMNIESDKKYTFTYKDDSDYYNDTLYKKRYDSTYGNYATGEQKEEKIELIFSPSPISKLSDTDRIAPYIYKQDASGTSRIKSNIRILYYNGVKTSVPYNIIDAKGANITTTPLNIYANCSHLRYVSGNTNYSYISDLNFGLAKEYFSGVDSTIYDTPNLFSNYKSLIKELNDPNFLTVECYVLLNEVDIANLDFKKPVYISTPNGDSYFKLLEVNYHNSNEVSQVKLQKIIV